MGSIGELKEALKENLEARGTLREAKALLRASVFHAFDDPQGPRPVLSNTNLVINELIREYLEFNNYKHTSSVFIPETGQPEEAFDTDFLASELNIVQNPQSRKIPLLYTMLGIMQQGPKPASSSSSSSVQQ